MTRNKNRRLRANRWRSFRESKNDRPRSKQQTETEWEIEDRIPSPIETMENKLYSLVWEYNFSKHFRVVDVKPIFKFSTQCFTSFNNNLAINLSRYSSLWSDLNDSVCSVEPLTTFPTLDNLWTSQTNLKFHVRLPRSRPASVGVDKSLALFVVVVEHNFAFGTFGVGWRRSDPEFERSSQHVVRSCKN